MSVFAEVYRKFKLYFYKSVFERVQNRELTLTLAETFCVEIIAAMGRPTINEFASYINISSPNATYKVNNLIQKGYVEKIQSDSDKREYFLKVTDKYYDYYNISQNYVDKVEDRLADKCSKEDVEAFYRVLQAITDDLMPEVTIKDDKN